MRKHNGRSGKMKPHWFDNGGNSVTRRKSPNLNGVFTGEGKIKCPKKPIVEIRTTKKYKNP